MTSLGVALPLALEPRRRLVAVALGSAEAWRMVRHPVALVGLGLWALVTVVVGGDGPSTAFDVPTTAATFNYGVFVYFAANLVTTRDRRADGEEVLAPAPADRVTRTAATCLAALGPALVAAVVVALSVGGYELLDRFEVRPTFWHLAQGPLTVLGGALLGIVVGRWAPYPGAAFLVMVAMVAGNVVTANSETWQPIGTFMAWARYTEDGSWGGVMPGSPVWHAVYLAALCAMAAVGAMLRDVPRRPPWLIVGGVLTVSAVLSGLAAVP